ncbi:hypothetical protein WR25_09884 [Diploscapter pachys]|uniref:Uncharacterized protein n=1 Tax=Diploscapter pachys TaxID=2018661 RepID=A0A2A2JC91_9BILA|nr:hypothetical protein WR25_09884 [Diploscapter pachys]
MGPHRLTDTHKQVRVNICQSLPLHLHRKEFLKNLVTGSESWILYDNDAQHAIWLPRDAEPPTQSKPNPTNASISSSFGGTRKGRYTMSCFLQAGLSQLPSASISFKNWSAQLEKNGRDAQLSTSCMTTHDYTSLQIPTKRPQSSTGIRSSTHRTHRASLCQITIYSIL